MVLLLAIISLAGLLFVAWEYLQGYASRTWPEVPGVVVQSKMAAFGNTKKVPLIYYQYDVNGKTYHSRRLSMSLTAVLKSEEAERLLDTYPVGAELVIKHHPHFKAFAVVEPGPRQPLAHLLLFAAFLVVFAVTVVAILKPEHLA